MERKWRVVRSRSAKNDLFEIWSYIAEHDIAAADQWLERIEAAINRLADFPSLGSMRKELPEDILAYSLNPYMLLYAQQPTEQLIEIIRVIDARRDFGSLFLT